MARLIAAFVLLLLFNLQQALCQQYQLIHNYTSANIFEDFDFFTVICSGVFLVMRVLTQSRTPTLLVVSCNMFLWKLLP